VRGSTNTNILRYPVVDKSFGDGLTATDSATLGTYITVAAEGLYSVSASGTSSGSGGIGIKRAAALNNNYAFTNTDFPLNIVSDGGTGGESSGNVYCNAGDLIWVAGNGALANNPTRAHLSVYGPLPLAD
jgi:hypothetical protein